MRQYRETEEKLRAEHPEMMAALKRQVLAQKPEAAKSAAPPAGEVPIDRRKNLETIMKFIENAPDQDALKRKLQTLLS